MSSSTPSHADDGVSPVIGVMLMIVVTIIVAAIVSAFAGGYTSAEKKAPTMVLSSRVLYGTGEGEFPNGGLLFTHESGNEVFLNSTYLVLANGVETRRFTISDLTPLGNYIIKTGNQFMLPAETDGSAVTDGYLGWTDPDFTLTTTEISTYKLVDLETGQTIAQGKINV